MITTVTQNNMVTIPAEVARKFSIKPGYKLDWQLVEGKDEIVVKVIPDRGELARRLCRMDSELAPGRNLATELDEEREREDLEHMKELGG
jgi:AbrB family looped-hinge helix DNA binding protein